MTNANDGATERHPDPKQYWFHRRMMAYISLAALITIGLVSVVVSVSEGAANVLQSLAWVFGTVIILYYSNNAAVEVATCLKGK